MRKGITTIVYLSSLQGYIRPNKKFDKPLSLGLPEIGNSITCPKCGKIKRSPSAKFCDKCHYNATV